MAARSIAVCTLSLFAVFLFASTLGPIRHSPFTNKRGTASGNAISGSATSSSKQAPLLYTAASRYDPFAWIHGEERFSAGATIFLRDTLANRQLIPSFALSSDPAVSFDGRRVLFAGKQESEDHWQIWEVSLAGGDPRRVTSCSEDCIRPFYLPEERVVYARRASGRFVLEAAPLAGGTPLQLTYGVGSALPNDVLGDGRILFEAISPFETGGTPELFTVYSDGSGVESYRCDHGRARHAGKQIRSGDIVFVSPSGLGRFTSARAQEVHVPAPVGDYAGDVAETASGNWLLSWRRDARSRFQLMSWKPSNDSGNGRPKMHTLYRRAQMPDPLSTGLHSLFGESGVNILQPVLVLDRPVPNRHPSALHDWANANLLCLNAYTSKFKFAENAIQSVRLYTKDNRGAAKLLGSATVERDGSFFIQVPTEQPLQIELLDGSGKILKREAGWFWMRRGEQRACVGCHAGPEIAPENAVPTILLQSTTPADLTGTGTPTGSEGR